MTDALAALAALLALAAFLGVLAVWVPELDLMIVLAVCIVLAAIDFYLALTAGKRSANRKARNAAERLSR